MKAWLFQFGRADAAGRPIVESLDEEIDLVIGLGYTGRAVRGRFKLRDLPVKLQMKL